jgi:hypothetical protein
MMSMSEPRLSVVVVTRDRFRTLRPIVRALAEQTVAETIELIVVAPSEAADGIPAAEASPFHSTRVVGVGTVVSRGKAAASGALAARAPVVALSENHCFPTKDWAERTLQAHEGTWAGVGPAVINANPESRQSRVLHAFGYGAFPPSASPGVVTELPLHNSSYRRDVLPEDLGELQNLLGDERKLQRTLCERGHALHFEPRALKRHINEATWGLLVGLSYSSGRRYGGTRARGWPLWRRVVYAAAAPLLTVPVTRHGWTRLAAADNGAKSLPLMGVVWCSALCHALGEAVSYLRGECEVFPFVENEEFFIRERLGGRAIRHPEVARLVALLDEPDSGTGRN